MIGKIIEDMIALAMRNDKGMYFETSQGGFELHVSLKKITHETEEEIFTEDIENDTEG